MRAVERGYLGMELLGTREDAMLGWEDLAGGGVEIHDVPGEHGNVLEEPHVQTVAEELEEDTAEAGNHGSAADSQPM